MMESNEKWETDAGVKFLKKIGVQPGQTVLDFGTRVGHYSIPAAITVGKTGQVYAIDKDPEALAELNEKTKRLNLTNIKPIQTDGNLALDFEAESFDTILLYDVLHYLTFDERKKLFAEIFRILKKSGLLSVYPKHVLGDSPQNMFAQLQVEDINQEIQDSNFRFKAKFCGTISHNDFLNEGCVFNFGRE